MKSAAQLDQSIERFRQVFWEKRPGRPPVGVVNPEVFLPITYLRRPLPHPVLAPDDVSRDLTATDYEFAFARLAVEVDDWIPFSAPWRAIPWLEAACGIVLSREAGRQ